jgi:hypothetical protein
MSTTAPEWLAEAVSLRAQDLSERQIAESVGKAPSTVHSWLVKYEAGDVTVNGNGHNDDFEVKVNGEAVGHGAEGMAAALGAMIPGQTTVDDHLPPSEEPPPADDPEHDVGTGEPWDGARAHGEGWGGKEEFEAEAGEAVGPMPPRETDAGETVYVEEIRIDGTTQIALDVGGKQPQACEITFTGKATVNGYFRKGDRLRISDGVILVTSEGAKDKLDKQTGIVTECTQVHSGKLVDLLLKRAG